MTNQSSQGSNQQDDRAALQQRIAELEQQVSMLTQALDHVPDMVLIKGPQSRIVYGNKAFRAMYNMSPEQLRDMIDAPFNNPDYTQQYIQDDEHVYHTGQTLDIAQEPVTRYDGEVRMFHTVKAPVYDSSGEVVQTVGVSRDITEQLQAAAELAQAEEAIAGRLRLFEEIVENTPDAIAMADLGGTISYTNDAFNHLYGYGAEAEGMHIADFVAGEDQERVKNMMQSLRDQGTWKGSLTYRTRDGSTFLGEQSTLYVQDQQGQPQAMAAIIRDITSRARTETALRDTETSYRQLIASIQDGVFVVQDGKLVFVNDSLAQMLGYPVGHLENRSFQEVIAPEDVTLVAERYRLRQQGEAVPAEYEFRMLHADGSRILVNMTANLTTYLGQVATIGTVRDIRERRAIETALYQSQNLLQGIFQNATMIMFVRDLEGRFLLLSQHYANQIGAPVDDLIGKTIDEVYAPDTANRLRSNDQQVRESGKAFHFEERVPFADGVHYYMAVKFPLFTQQGELYAIGGISTDITRRKHIQEKFQTFHALAENAPDGIIVSDLNSMVTYMNAAFRSLTGYTDEDLGRHMYDFYTDDPHDLQPITGHAMEHGFWQGQLTYRRKDGSSFTGQLSLFTITNAEGQPVALARIIRDLTAQQQAAADHSALQQQLISTQQNAIRELSTPLMPISDTIVVMPLVGTIDSGRSQQIMETLLEGIARQQAEVAILDITGVQIVDTQVANGLLQTAQAVRLLGAQVILTGISPTMAQTLVHLGADLNSVVTRSSLRSGIAYAMAIAPHEDDPGSQRGEIGA